MTTFIIFLAQILEDLMHGGDFVNPMHVGATEGESALEIALHGTGEREGDAVGRLFRIAGLHAVVDALERLFLAST